MRSYEACSGYLDCMHLRHVHILYRRDNDRRICVPYHGDVSMERGGIRNGDGSKHGYGVGVHRNRIVVFGSGATRLRKGAAAERPQHLAKRSNRRGGCPYFI